MTAAVTSRARHRPDGVEGISASELLARYADAGLDRPSRVDRRAAALKDGSPAHESPAHGSPAHGSPAHGSLLHVGHDPADVEGTVVTRDAPAGLGSDGVGLIRGRTSESGAFGRNPRAVAATMGATLVGATAVMGVVTAFDAPGDAAADLSTPVDKAGAEQATMKLSAVGTPTAAGSLGQAPAGMPAAFQQADAARIASTNLAAAKKAADRKAAADRAAASRPAASDTPDTGGLSSMGLKALEMAKSKLGKPYVWGADGPNAFDCSGLMKWAFEQVGEDLPRTSSAQSQVGQKVGKSDLQPGDMVFFYSPVSHVGIYAGNGRVLHASEAGEPVKYPDLDAMPFSGARRM